MTSPSPIHHPASPSLLLQAPPGCFPPETEPGACSPARSRRTQLAGALWQSGAEQTDVSNPGREGGRGGLGREKKKKNTAELSQIKSLRGLGTALLESAYSYSGAARRAQAHGTARTDRRHQRMILNAPNSSHVFKGSYLLSPKPYSFPCPHTP